jgi:hypothetical protein
MNEMEQSSLLLRQSFEQVCKPDIIYVLNRAHGLHFFALV